MKKLFVAVLVLVACISGAQQATLNTPLQPPSEARYEVQSLFVNANGAVIVIDVKASNGVTLRSFNVDVPDAAHPGATVAAIFTALDTAVSGETGGVLRRANARLLDYCIDFGYISGVTLVP
jgi:hypothetical protein